MEVLRDVSEHGSPLYFECLCRRKRRPCHKPLCPLTSPSSLKAVASRVQQKHFRGLSHGIVHYDTSAMKHFLTSVSLQHEPKASDVITLVKKTFFRTSIVRHFISRGVKMRISAREACVKPYLRTRSDINIVKTR